MKYRNHYITPKYSRGDETYYGNVDGTPDIPLISAKTMEEFEDRFKSAVDLYLDGPRGGRPLLWPPIAILVLSLVFVTMILTCPKKAQHVEVLSDRIAYVISDRLGDVDDRNMFSAAVMRSLSGRILEPFLVVDDYIVVSVGRMKHEGRMRVVSVGAFGHIFATSREEFKERLAQDEELGKVLGGRAQ